jgi:hypothetical protein
VEKIISEQSASNVTVNYLNVVQNFVNIMECPIQITHALFAREAKKNAVEKEAVRHPHGLLIIVMKQIVLEGGYAINVIEV